MSSQGRLRSYCIWIACAALLCGGFSRTWATEDSLALARSEVHAALRPMDAIGMAPIVITAAQWEGRGQSLADLLASHAGIQTRRMGGAGSMQTISIRGVAGNKVLICVDGVPLEDGSGHAVNLGGIDLNGLERIEVSKGQVPARLGGNGLGGVVNLVTRKQVHTGGKLEVLYGSHNTGETSLSLASPISDSLRWSSSLSWKFSDNDYRYLDRNGTPYNSKDDVYRNRSNAQFAQFGGNHVLTWILPSGELSFQVAHAQLSGGIPGVEAEETHVAGFDQQWVAPRVVWTQNPWNNGWRLEAELEGRGDLSKFHWSNRIDGLGYATGNQDYQEAGSRTLRAEGAVHLLGEWSGRYGLEWHLRGLGEQLDPRDNPHEPFSWQWKLQRHSTTSALEGSWAPLSWLALRSNYQFTGVLDHNSGGILRTTYPDTMAASVHSTVRQSAQGSLRLGKADALVRTQLQFGHHYRIPELQELFSTSMGVLPNPDLQPEEGENAELGWEGNVAHSRWQVSSFWNQSRNGVYWVRSAGFSKPMNLSRGRTIGLECEFHAKPLHVLDVSWQGTWQDPRNRSLSRAYRNRLLPNEPKGSVGSEAILHIGKFDVSCREEWRSTVYRDEANQMRIAPQWNLHAGLGVIPWKQARIGIQANNLNGAESQDIYSAYPTPGRQFFLNFAQTF